MSQEQTTPEHRLAQLALAIVQENDLLAMTLIEYGVPLTGKRLPLPAPPSVPSHWFEDGLSPLTWVVNRMLDKVRGDDSDPLPMRLRSVATQFGLPQSEAKQYSAEVEKSLEALSQIGGALILAGASADVRLGRTARSQKALDALAVYLPEYATSLRAAAHQKLLRGLVKKDPRRNESTAYTRRM